MAEEELNSLTACDHLFYNYRKTEPYHYDCIKSITIKLNDPVEVVVSIEFSGKCIVKEGRIIRIKRIIESRADSAFVLVFRMEDRSIRFSTEDHRINRRNWYTEVDGKCRWKGRWKGLTLDEINNWLACYYSTNIFNATDFENKEELNYVTYN